MKIESVVNARVDYIFPLPPSQDICIFRNQDGCYMYRIEDWKFIRQVSIEGTLKWRFDGLFYATMSQSLCVVRVEDGEEFEFDSDGGSFDWNGAILQQGSRLFCEKHGEFVEAELDKDIDCKSGQIAIKNTIKYDDSLKQAFQACMSELEKTSSLKPNTFIKHLCTNSETEIFSNRKNVRNVRKFFVQVNKFSQKPNIVDRVAFDECFLQVKAFCQMFGGSSIDHLAAMKFLQKLDVPCFAVEETKAFVKLMHFEELMQSRETSTLSIESNRVLFGDQVLPLDFTPSAFVTDRHSQIACVYDKNKIAIILL